MALKDMLVHIDNSKACDGRVKAAITLARAHDARLTGLYIIGAPSLPTFVDAQLPEEFIRQQQRGLKESAEQAKSRFIETVEKNGLIADCRIDSEAREPVPLAFARHARYVDLAIVGQPNPDEDELPGSPLVESAFLATGRPALVVPYIGAPASIGTRIIIAWDGSREAARAVNDALPILAKAQSVTVLAVNPKDGTQGRGLPPAADIALHLARHDITVESKVAYADDIGVGDVLLSRAADEGVDLIVMGGYGHSRLREIVLGGVTRHMLQHMTVPVLMSH